MILIQTEEELNKHLKENKHVLVDFSATWCGPCKFLAPVLEKLEKELTNVKFLKIDIDASQTLAEKHQIRSVPTIEIYNSAAKKADFSGFRPESFVKKFIEDNLN